MTPVLVYLAITFLPLLPLIPAWLAARQVLALASVDPRQLRNVRRLVGLCFLAGTLLPVLVKLTAEFVYDRHGVRAAILLLVQD